MNTTESRNWKVNTFGQICILGKEYDRSDNLVFPLSTKISKRKKKKIRSFEDMVCDLEVGLEKQKLPSTSLYCKGNR